MKNILFEKLYNSFYEDVYKYSLYLSRNKDLAEEITQEAFYRAWVNMDKLINHENIKGWLINTVKYINIHYQSYNLKNNLFFYKYPIYNSYSYNNYIDMIEIHDLFDNIKKNLSFDDIRLINLFYFDNHKIKSIAKEFNVSENVIKVRLHRLRKKIHNIIISYSYQANNLLF